MARYMIINDEQHRGGMNAELDAIETTRKAMIAAQAANAAAAAAAGPA
jgi:hypothetical protein